MVLPAAEAALGDDPIHITTTPTEHCQTDITLSDEVLPHHGDGAAALRGQPGLNLARMGGHGLDPVVRGQQHERVLVEQGGVMVHGGCPNRMDPPTAYASIDLFDTLRFTRGVTSMTGLPPSPAGSVDFQRDDPAQGWHGSTSLRGSGDAPVRGASAGSSWADEQWFGRASLNWEDAGNYRDGDGNVVRSAYTQSGGSLDGGWRGDAASARLEVGAVNIDDALFAGAGMDSPKSDLRRAAASGDWNLGDEGVVSGGQWRFGYATVDHVMDNYTLRELTAPRQLRVDSTTESLVGDADIVLRPVEDGALRLGLSGTRENLDASRFTNDASGEVNSLQSLLWPDVTTEDLGVYGEYRHELDEYRFTVGLRVDRVDAEAASRNVDPSPITPMMNPPAASALYNSYYGVTGEDVSETNLGGLLRAEGPAGLEGLQWFGALSQVTRSASGNERFLAAWAPGMMANMRWVGNPSLEPEVHRQLELGVASSGDTWQVELTGFYDDVSDWIMRDTARGQDGIRLADGASIYRNVDASLFGGELSGLWGPVEHLELTASLGYVHGDNDTDDKPLAQMPPLGGRLGAAWNTERWAVGLVMDWAARQDRIDEDSNLDIDETAGWAVLGAWGRCELDHGLTLEAGVDNIFNHNYATHLNRASAFDPTVERVNEPGFDAWVGGRWEF
jgi:iron complex outermembrane receptor protein